MTVLKKYAWFILLLIVVALPVFAHLTDLPIQLWDEARQAHSAYEMLQTGDWLVGTFDYMPDMWNTKPPLLIWIMAGSMKLFGVNELGVRFPSAIAAMFTFIYLFWFIVKVTGNERLAFLAGFVLATSEGYIKLHGTRTGDYDATLTFFTTAYIGSYFLFLQTKSSKHLWSFFLCLVAAVYTKGIAGMLMLPGLAVYTLLSKKTLTVLRSGSFYSGFAVFILFVMGFYLLREHYNPGFISAVFENEIGGRFSGIVEHHIGGPLYYITLLQYPHFSYWYMFIPLGIVSAIFSKEEIQQSLACYALLISTLFYIVISSSASKLSWYDLQVFPILSMPVAFAIEYVAAKVEKTEISLYLRIIALATLAGFIFILPYSSVLEKVFTPKAESQFDLNINMADFLRKSKEGRWSLDGYTFIEDSRAEQNITFYLKTSKYRVNTKWMGELVAGDTVAVYKQDVKNTLHERYKTEMLHSYGDVQVFLIQDTINAK